MALLWVRVIFSHFWVVIHSFWRSNSDNFLEDSSVILDFSRLVVVLWAFTCCREEETLWNISVSTNRITSNDYLDAKQDGFHIDHLKWLQSQYVTVIWEPQVLPLTVDDQQTTQGLQVVTNSPVHRESRASPSKSNPSIKLTSKGPRQRQR